MYIDPSPDEDSDEGCAVGQMECRRATNGNCLLVWRTIYESPGKHALQMGLDLNEPARADEVIVGLVAPFTVSNLCQFSYEWRATILRGSFTVITGGPAYKSSRQCADRA